MGFFQRFFNRKRRQVRITVQLPVGVEVSGEQVRGFSTEDLSLSGLQMEISDVASLSELTGGGREVAMCIDLTANEVQIRVMAEPIWTRRSEDGRQFSGWMFCNYMGESREQLEAFIGAFQEKE